MIAIALLIAIIGPNASLAGVHGATDPLEITVLNPQTVLASDARVGRRRIGLLCVGSGKWLWRDIRSEPASLRVSIERGLLQAGVATQDQGAADFAALTPPGHFRLRGTIQAVSIDSCSSWSGARALLNKPLRYHGKIMLQMRWQLYSASAERIVADFEHLSETTFSDVASIDDVLSVGLTANAGAAGLRMPKLDFPIR